ncbi:MAG: uncharacterized protein QOJ76_3180 [Acidobacteriota bacterium]|jgi:hypothetical protein|nr:uncharacterized protein [Acidobacteriota bacterium]
MMRNRTPTLAAVAALLCVLCASAEMALAQDAMNDLPVLSKMETLADVATPDVFPEGRELLWPWRYEYDKPTKFLILHIDARGFPDDDSWTLLIMDGDGNVRERLTARSLRWTPTEPGQPQRAERWTAEVPGRKVSVELHATRPPRGLRIAIDKLQHSFFKPGERVLTTGSNDMRDLVAAFGRDHRYYGYGRSVAIIYLPMPDGSGVKTNCTGFLVAPDLLMTNRHCISQPWQLETATAVFGYESQPTLVETLSFLRIEAQDAPLDFTILRLSRPASSNWPVAKLDLTPVQNNQNLVLIQHPSDQQKIISRVGCTVQTADVTDRPQNSNDFYHLCDADGGSSGSPAINEATGRVVGLHHGGISRPLKQGFNFAVKIAPILERLKCNPAVEPGCNPTLYDEIIRQSQ